MFGTYVVAGRDGMLAFITACICGWLLWRGDHMLLVHVGWAHNGSLHTVVVVAG